VHVLAARERDFMPIAAEIRKVLRDQGIHSCTIQPEYYGARVAMEVRVFLPPIPSVSPSYYAGADCFTRKGQRRERRHGMSRALPARRMQSAG
jgi:hypothetical protein